MGVHTSGKWNLSWLRHKMTTSSLQRAIFRWIWFLVPWVSSPIPFPQPLFNILFLGTVEKWKKMLHTWWFFSVFGHCCNLIPQEIELVSPESEQIRSETSMRMSLYRNVSEVWKHPWLWQMLRSPQALVLLVSTQVCQSCRCLDVIQDLSELCWDCWSCSHQKSWSKSVKGRNLHKTGDKIDFLMKRR